MKVQLRGNALWCIHGFRRDNAARENRDPPRRGHAHARCHASGGRELTFSRMAEATAHAHAGTALRAARCVPPRAPDLRAALSAAEAPLAVHAMTIPAYGHYQTLKGILLALAARGHNVTLLGCAATGADAASDALLGPQGAHGGSIAFLSLGACPAYERREAALGALISGAPGGVGAVLAGVREVSQDLCRGAMAYYGADAARLPAALVFDADTYCAMDVSVRHRIPRVARVGTGLRDAYTTPLGIPAFSTGRRLAMGLPGRLANAATLALSRAVIAPLLLPWLYSGHRAEWLGAQRSLVSHGSRTLDEAAMAPHLLWDGVPTLYNSHWGLEHARPLAPYEHLIGHTNDFEGDARRPLDSALLAWLAARPGAPPVVYVGLGTLGVLPLDWVARLARALALCPHARFVWSVPTAQQAQLPPAITAASRLAHCLYSGSSSGGEGCGGSEAQATAPGSVFLVPWVPQLAVLTHPAVAAFATHGGMNGIAEGLYARLPLLCIPLFADQPDNCAHAADKGYAAQLALEGLEPGGFAEALGGLLAQDRQPQLRAALQDAWVRTVAAGGAARAVGIIEAAAALPYGAHLAEVPEEFFLVWYQRWGLDVAAVALLLVCALALLCARACRLAQRSLCKTKQQ